MAALQKHASYHLFYVVMIYKSLDCSDNVLPEEPPGARGQDVVQDGPAARALPGDGHPGGVPPEVEDVLLHPVEGELLVPDTLNTAGEPLALFSPPCTWLPDTRPVSRLSCPRGPRR